MLNRLGQKKLFSTSNDMAEWLYGFVTEYQQTVVSGLLPTSAMGLLIHVIYGIGLGKSPRESGLTPELISEILNEAIRLEHWTGFKELLTCPGLWDLLSPGTQETIRDELARRIGRSYNADKFILDEFFYQNPPRSSDILKAIPRVFTNGNPRDNKIDHFQQLLELYSSVVQGKLIPEDVEQLKKVMMIVYILPVVMPRKYDGYFYCMFTAIWKSLSRELPFAIDVAPKFEKRTCFRYWTYQLRGLDRVLNLESEREQLEEYISYLSNLIRHVNSRSAENLLDNLEYYLSKNDYLSRIIGIKSHKPVTNKVLEILGILLDRVQPSVNIKDQVKVLCILSHSKYHRLFTLFLYTVNPDTIEWNKVITSSSVFAQTIWKNSETCFVTLLDSGFFSPSQVRSMQEEMPYRGSTLAKALFETWFSLKRVEVVDFKNARTIIWDIPDIFLSLEEVTMSDISWCFRMFLWHHVDIPLESTRFNFDASDEEFDRIEYEFVLNFFVERRAALYNQQVGTKISIPKACFRTVLPETD